MTCPGPIRPAGRAQLPAGPTLLVVAAALTGLAWANRFVLDDAFISFRYAAHAAEGLGFVWNVGEAVEGYTNFLWTWLLSVVLRLGLEPVLASQLMGLACHLGTLLAVGAIARRLSGSLAAAAATQIALGTAYTFSAYGTSGLETALQTATLTAATALLVLRPPGQFGPARGLALSLTLAAAVMTRLDSAVIGAWLGLSAVGIVARADRPARDRLLGLAALALPFGLLVGSWLLWKLEVYGDILPNTFHAKAAQEPRLDRGLAWMGLFAGSYVLWGPLALAGLGLRGLGALRGPLGVGGGALASWIAYVCWVGGDFMEFRFMVAASPLLYLVLVGLGWRALGEVQPLLTRPLLVAWFVVGSAWHAATFEGRDGVEPISMLAAHLTQPAQDWLGVGRALGDAFADDPTVRIATTAAGAIPYVSALPAVDMLGLTDRWIARHGRRFGAQLGHDRVAPLSYLVAREVHLMLGQPWLIRPSPPARTRYEFVELRGFHVLAGEPASAFPPTSAILEIPLDPTRRLVALYLRPHPAVERAIAELGWRRYPIAARGPGATL